MSFQFWGSFPRVVFEIDFFPVNFFMSLISSSCSSQYFYTKFYFISSHSIWLKNSHQQKKSIYHPFNFPIYMELRDFDWVWRGLMEIGKKKDRNDIQVKFIHIFLSIKFSHRCQKLAKSLEKLQTTRKLKTKLTFLDNFLWNTVPDIFL